MPTTQSRRWWTLSALGLVQFLVIYASTATYFAGADAFKRHAWFPRNAHSFLEAFALPFVTLLLPFGKIASRWGTRHLMLLGVLVFTIGSVLASSATNSSVLLVALAIMGATSALLTVTVLGEMARAFSVGTERAQAFALFSVIASAGIAVPFLLGSAFVEWSSWRLIFIVAAVLGVLALGSVRVSVVGKGVIAGTGRVDPLRVIALGGGLLFLNFGLLRAMTTKWPLFTGIAWPRGTVNTWANYVTWSSLVLGAALISTCALIEHRRATATRLLRLLGSRTRLGAFVTLALTSAALFPLFLPLANFIEADLRTSPLRTGIYFLPLVIATALSATFASARLLPENGPRPLIPTGMILSTMGMVLLTRITDLPNYWGHIFGGLLLVGLGLGLIVPGAIKSTFADVSPSESMDVAALVGIVLWISGALSAAFLTTVIAHVSAEPFYSTSKQGYALRHFNYVHGFSVAFWISAVLFGVGAIFSFIIFRTPSQRGEMSGASTQISGQG